MAGGLIKVNTQQLDEFAKKLEKAASNDIKDFIEKCAKELAIEILRRTIQKTPKRLGNLQRGWTAEPGHKPCSEYNTSRSPQKWAEMAKIQKSGGTYKITISNPIEYAVYVEYGHRMRDHIRWKPGEFMLTLSIAEVESMKVGLLQQLLIKFLGDLFE